MSANAAGDGEGLGTKVEEESPKFAAMDKSFIDVINNTFYLKFGCLGV